MFTVINIYFTEAQSSSVCYNKNYILCNKRIPFLIIVLTFQFFRAHAAAAAKSLQSCPTLCDPHRQQPTRLLCPWDSPGKNTGVGCHFLFQCMHAKLLQSCLTLCNPMDSSQLGSSVHRISRQEYWSGLPFPSPTSIHDYWKNRNFVYKVMSLLFNMLS